MKASALFLLVLVAFSLGLSHRSVCVGWSDEASSAIEGAENVLRQAFEAVLEAERAGANISSLMTTLNEAGRLLAEAEIAYGIGNSGEAVSEADQCYVLVNGVIGEALSLKSSVLADAQRISMQTLTLSLMGSVAFLIVLFFAWGLFKRVYAKRLLKMKPEVACDVEV